MLLFNLTNVLHIGKGIGAKYEGIAMTAPGIVAHQSALQNGKRLIIPDFDKN